MAIQLDEATLIALIVESLFFGELAQRLLRDYATDTSATRHFHCSLLYFFIHIYCTQKRGQRSNESAFAYCLRSHVYHGAYGGSIHKLKEKYANFGIALMCR